MATTKEQVWETADAITAEGGRPTLANVRERLGGGSYTDISQHMQTWRARQQAIATPTREPAPAAITERLKEVATDLWAVALEMANSRLQAEREALEQAMQKTEQTRQEAIDLADQIAAELDIARAEIERQAQQYAEARKEIDSLQTQLDARAQAAIAAEHRADMAEAARTELQYRANHLATLLDQEREAHTQAEARARIVGEDAAELRGRLIAAGIETEYSPEKNPPTRKPRQ
jgi:chromosome segregation ATPase